MSMGNDSIDVHLGKRLRRRCRLLGLTQQQLARTLFPLGGLTKPQVRELAGRFHLPVASKRESYEICFVPNGDYAAFLEMYLRDKGSAAPAGDGEIVTSEGRTLGRHTGVHHFTVGQRKGLGIATGEPLYVDNTLHPANARLALARASGSRLSAFGLHWEDASKQNNGHFAPFSWKSA